MKTEQDRKLDIYLYIILMDLNNNVKILFDFTGKYESNYTAQQLAVTYANHIIECLEVLVIFWRLLK